MSGERFLVSVLRSGHQPGQDIVQVTPSAALRDRALLGWPAHPAYVMGARRLSCSLCFLGDLVSLEAGARHNPEYYQSLCWLGIQSGYSFQPTRWLCDVAPDLLTDEMRWLLEQYPRRQAWLIATAQRAQHKATN